MLRWNALFKFLFIVLSLFLLWQGAIYIGNLPHYLLPNPKSVLLTFLSHYELILEHTFITLAEIFLGLTIGISLGIISALLLSLSRFLSSLLLPLFVISQAIPVFAVAPLFVLWFGYGMASKIVMTVLIIYFPVTASCFDGLRQTPKGWLELAQTYRLSPLQLLLKVRLPSALPSLSSGIRIAVSVAPIGAVVGEWVGSSQGLGYLMLHANARMQVDLMFVALFTLLLIALVLYLSTDKLLKKWIPWVNQVR